MMNWSFVLKDAFETRDCFALFDFQSWWEVGVTLNCPRLQRAQILTPESRQEVTVLSQVDRGVDGRNKSCSSSNFSKGRMSEAGGGEEGIVGVGELRSPLWSLLKSVVRCWSTPRLQYQSLASPRHHHICDSHSPHSSH
jgi:hypothetical protein